MVSDVKVINAISMPIKPKVFMVRYAMIATQIKKIKHAHILIIR